MNTYDNDNKNIRNENESTSQQKPAAPGSADQANTGTFPYTT